MGRTPLFYGNFYMTVNLSSTQLATVAMEAYQDGAFEIADAFNIPTKDARAAFADELTQKTDEIAASAYRRYRNAAGTAIDPDADDAMERLSANLKLKQQEAQLEEDALAVVFWAKYNALMNDNQHQCAQKLIESLPACMLKSTAETNFKQNMKDKDIPNL